MDDLVENYFRHFGQNQRSMAASPESIHFCVNLIKNNGLQSILDAGSGLSSTIFHSNFHSVRSIDDSKIWATKTEEFILHQLRIEISIPSITSISSTEGFDFVFYDYGGIETRIYYFQKILGLSNKYIYLDDMHIGFYREYIESKVRSHYLKYLPETKDEFGRFGALILKT